MELKQIATIHTDFPEKFGIPRQSGLVGQLKGQIILEPASRNREAFRDLRNILISGCFGNFHRRREKNGHRPLNRRALAEISGWAYLQRVLRSARIRSGFPH